jgi:ABC-type lipopolysaccharide export system ATPase subunit
MPHLLEIDSVQKSFGQNRVLTDVYLRCETGDIIGLLGRNGSGKSTFLKILFGVIPAEQKFIRIDGRKYDHPYKTAGELCYLPQNPFLPRDMTLGTAVKLYLPTDQAVLFFNDPVLHLLQSGKISHLSGGEVRYAEIKLLLNSNVKFILLDEPFNGIAPMLVETVKSMIRRHSEHKGVILTDHDYRNVLDVANRHYLFADGGLKPIRDKEDLVIRGYMSPAAAAALRFEPRPLTGEL